MTMMVITRTKKTAECQALNSLCSKTTLLSHLTSILKMAVLPAHEATGSCEVAFGPKKSCFVGCSRLTGRDILVIAWVIRNTRGGGFQLATDTDSIARIWLGSLENSSYLAGVRCLPLFSAISVRDGPDATADFISLKSQRGNDGSCTMLEAGWSV